MPCTESFLPSLLHLRQVVRVGMVLVLSGLPEIAGDDTREKAESVLLESRDHGKEKSGTSEPLASSWRVLRISEHGSYGLPVWSPDGQKLAFVSVQEAGRMGVWVIDRGGTAPVLLAEYGGPSEGDHRLVPAALDWLGEPQELMLAVLVFEESALRAYSPPVVTQKMERLLFAPSSGTASGGQGSTTGIPVRLLHRYVPGNTGVRPPEPKEIRAYRISLHGPSQSRRAAVADPSKLRSVQGWSAVSHSGLTPDRKGVALCFCADDDGPDDGHAGTVLVLRQDGEVCVGSKPFRWLESLPDGRLVGGRIDGIWTLNDRGEPQTRLVATDRPRRLDHFRMAPDGRRVIWADYGFPHGLTWWLGANGTNRVLTIRSRNGSPLQVANIEFLSADRIVVHGTSADAPSARLWIATPDGEEADPWTDARLPQGAFWMDVSPEHHMMLVLGRRFADRLAEWQGCALRVENGTPILESAGDVPLSGLPILNLNRKRACTRLVVWAPGRPAYAQTTEVKGRLIGADRPPRNELVIVWVGD